MSNKNKGKQFSKQAWKGGENQPDFEVVNGQFDHIQPVLAKPLEVVVNQGFERAFRLFKSLVQKEGVLSLYKERQRFEKKSDKLRRKKIEAKRRLLEAERKFVNPTFKKKFKDKETSEEVSDQ